MNTQWLAFQPAYRNARGAQHAVLGAHAFDEGAERSVCGYAPAAKTRGAARNGERRCVWCMRLLARRSA